MYSNMTVEVAGNHQTTGSQARDGADVPRQNEGLSTNHSRS